MSLNKEERRQRIRYRIRKRIAGTGNTPRLSVFRSNKEIYAQLVNDQDGSTIMTVSSRDKAIASKKGNKVDIAALVGKSVATKAIEKGISTVTFDRNGYLYHGRVKSLAEAAREAGLKF